MQLLPPLLCGLPLKHSQAQSLAIVVFHTEARSSEVRLFAVSVGAPAAAAVETAAGRQALDRRKEWHTNDWC
jgi:hypothetical protein